MATYVPAPGCSCAASWAAVGGTFPADAGRAGRPRARGRAGRDRRGHGSRGRTVKGVADSFPEGQEADGLLNAAQGDVEGVETFGLAEEAVQTGLQEFQLLQEGGGAGVLGVAAPGREGAAEMLQVAGESRSRQAIVVGQGAEGQAVHQGAVDLGQGRVIADGAALVHGELRKRIFEERIIEGRTGGLFVNAPRPPLKLPSQPPIRMEGRSHGL